MVLDPNVRVLIADADAVVRQQIHKRLLDGDIFSDAVADGRSAVELLRERPYAVLLLDLSLPQLGADSILEYLSRIPTERRPVILVLATGNAARSLDVELVQIVLRKPCNLKQLSEIVRSCVLASTAGVPTPPPDPAQAIVRA